MLRDEMLHATHPWGVAEPAVEEDGWIVLGDAVLWRIDNRELGVVNFEEMPADPSGLFIDLSETWGLSRWEEDTIKLKYFLTQICPNALDVYGVAGWELFFKMVRNWSGDFFELPVVVATLLERG